jgi:phosphatidylglycerophosphate synthase
MPHYTLNDIKKTICLDSWWGRFFLDPFSIRLTWLIVNFTRLTPNVVTLLTIPFSVASAVLFYLGQPRYLIFGALLYEFGFLLDTVDGKLARLLGKSSRLGAFLDIYLDTINVFINLTALVVGQYLRYGEAKFLVIGMTYLFLHLVQLLNKYVSLHTLGHDFKKDFYEDYEGPGGEGLLGRMKRIFAKRRLSLILFSTVEGEAFVFFLGPITGYIYESIVLSAVLVTVFYILKSIFYLRSCAEADRGP